MRTGRRLAFLALATVLAGCVQGGAPAPVRVVSLEPPSPAEACAGASCSWEWWNLTVEGGAWGALHVPMPYVVPHRARTDVGRDGADWARNLTVEGAGRAWVERGEGAQPLLRAQGSGDVVARAHRARTAGPTGFAEDFLRARWGPEANQTRPDAVEARLAGPVEGLRLTYEARGGLCERRSVFTLAEAPGGAAWARGSDEVTCR